MTLIVGIIGAATLFALFAFAASREETRLEGGGSCQGDAESPDSCTVQEDCHECGETKNGSGWWPVTE
jgi:hypothetical protein